MAEKESISSFLGGDLKTYLIGIVVAGYIGVDRFTPIGHSDNGGRIEDLKQEIKALEAEIEHETEANAEQFHNDIEEIYQRITRLETKHETD